MGQSEHCDAVHNRRLLSWLTGGSYASACLPATLPNAFCGREGAFRMMISKVMAQPPAKEEHRTFTMKDMAAGCALASSVSALAWESTVGSYGSREKGRSLFRRAGVAVTSKAGCSAARDGMGLESDKRTEYTVGHYRDRDLLASTMRVRPSFPWKRRGGMSAYKGAEGLCSHKALKGRASAYLYTRGAFMSSLRLLLLASSNGWCGGCLIASRPAV